MTMRQWVMASRPQGQVRPDNFALEVAPIPVISPGQVLLKVLYLGVAPVMLRYMTNETDFEPPMEVGDVMRGRGVGRVVESLHPDYAIGDVLQCKLGWREFAVIDDAANALPFKMAHRDLPLSHGISSLAMSGFTALAGMRDIGLAKPGDRTLVSSAAGGVGSQVGFVAKELGCRPVVGIAGGAHKCRMLTRNMGYDAAIDYKGDDLDEQLDKYFPDGIDLFFDNVGGALLDNVLGRIREKARIVICGRISEYLQDPAEYHNFRNVSRLGLQSAKMEGFFIYHLQPHFREYETAIAAMIRGGRLQPTEDIRVGLEQLPQALISLYEGNNCGVCMVRVDPEVDAQFSL